MKRGRERGEMEEIVSGEKNDLYTIIVMANLGIGYEYEKEEKIVGEEMWHCVRS